MKKVSAKHFYNKKVKTVCNNSLGVQAYALYIRVIYNRKSTEFRSKIHHLANSKVKGKIPGIIKNDTLYVYPQQDNEAFIKYLEHEGMSYSDLEILIKAEKQVVKDLHSYFADKLNRVYPLSFFNDTIDHAITPIHEIINKSRLNFLKLRLKGNEKYTSFINILDPNAEFDIIVEAVSSLTSSFKSEFPMYFFKVTEEIKQSTDILKSLIPNDNASVIECLKNGLTQDITYYIESRLNNHPPEFRESIAQYLNLIKEFLLDKDSILNRKTL